MNILDRLAREISPTWALARQKARFAAEQFSAGVRKFEAAGLGRRTDGWRTTSAGANNENRPALRLLRDRSRDLVRNNPFAKRAIQIIGTNVVGSGIQPAIIGAANKQTRTLGGAWQDWAASSACDFDGLLNFYGIQRSAIRAMGESGEVLLVRKRLTPDEIAKYGGPGIQLQLLESDFLDMGRDGLIAEGGGRILQGVEFNKDGRRVAYWLFKSHPGESYHWGANTSVRIPAEDVLHLFDPLRPGQIRGIPMGVSAMLRLRDFDEYEDAQLVRQKIAACFAVFYNGIDADSGLAADNANQGEIPSRVEPGMIEKLPPGSTVEIASPPAALGYSEYSNTVLRSIAAGYGVTYEQLTGDMSNVNFTSARMARMEFDSYVAELQSLLIVQLCSKVWAWFTAASYVSGAAKKPVVPVKWTTPARKMVDPVKEVKAFKDAVRAGFMSWSDAVLSLGNNPDELRELLAQDFAALDAAKLVLTSDPRKFADAGMLQPTENPAAKAPAVA